MGISMNASETQMLFLDNAGNMADVTVMVNKNSDTLSNTIKLLGVNYNHKLTTDPHVKAMPTTVRQSASIITCLAKLLPGYLRQLATGLVVGKFSHGLAEVTAPRLPAANAGEEATPSTLFHRIQVTFHNVARSITGVRLRDRVSILKLLDLDKIPSINTMIVKAVGLEA
jgi:hypothetical protein